MTALEDALKAALREHANRQAPEIGDLAARVIAAGRAQRRRRMGGGLAAAVIVCAVITASLVIVVGAHAPVDDGAVFAAPGSYVAVSSPMPQVGADLPVDYVQAGSLYLRGGRVVKLPATDVTQVQRAGDGFVVVARIHGDQQQRAWYVNERTGAPAILLDRVRSVVVAADGTGRMAWVDGSKMYYQDTVATVSRTVVQSRPVETDRPGSGNPVGFVGDAVLLADPGPAEPERHDLWFPARGDYEPTWASFLAVYGVRASTELVVARKTKKNVCLGFARMSTLKLAESGCHYVDRAPTRGWVSPSGRWLVVADEQQAQMFDLSTNWRTGAQVAWSVDRVGPDAAWLDRDTVALHTSTGVVVLSPFADEKAVEYKVPGLSLLVGQ